MKNNKWELKRIIFYLGISLCIGIFIFSIFNIGKYMVASAENKNTNKEIQETFYQHKEPIAHETKEEIILETNQAEEDSLVTREEKDESTVAYKEISQHFEPLLEINEETVGWIKIDNTVIDYPVVQAKDNDYYLDHNFQKEKSSAGALFLDYRNSIDDLDQNTIIYGHHMKDGSMFKGLVKYRNPDFYKANRTITFETLYREMKWEIFAVYITDTDFNYINPNFKDGDEFQGFLQKVEEKSQYELDTSIEYDDKILTLSTCDYDFDDARLVVQAKLIAE
ncbi:class B sortase [Lederbergia graminis]|uniref:Class B sortase n=1 Tax=Lederbergia graminis TaxID=735518 RepID=A0ABW0LHX3_9BACI